MSIKDVIPGNKIRAVSQFLANPEDATKHELVSKDPVDRA